MTGHRPCPTAASGRLPADGPASPRDARRPLATAAALAAAVAATVVLAGCVPAVAVVGIGTSAMMAADPRSMGAQIDDETIELKLQTDPVVLRENVHLNVASYNGVVLLVGQAPTAAVRDEIGALAKATDRVRAVNNELTVGPNTEYSVRSNDAFITGKVKTRLLDEGKVAPNRVKVVTENSVVYLMGIVPRDEGDKIAKIAATTSGVARVVKLFETPAG
jgi:osmotically-inducible protein OsmY